MPTEKDPLTVDVPREFHRRMAAIIDAVQTGVWQEGVHDLLGYATDYAFGQQRGLQTLVLKSKHRSAYVRLYWDSVMGDTDADRQLVDEGIRNAINELRCNWSDHVHQLPKQEEAAVHPKEKKAIKQQKKHASDAAPFIKH